MISFDRLRRSGFERLPDALNIHLINKISITDDPIMYLVVAGAANAEEVGVFSGAAHFSANQMVKREIARRTTEMAWLLKPLALCPARS